jgi:Ca-activated chloride channel family protein
MVFDVSRSMAAEDYGPRSRLVQARDIARHLLAQLHGNRVGLITFAGTSFPQAGLTADLSALDFILQYWVGIDATRVGGSDIAQALATGLTLFHGSPERHRLMLVFSDGGDTSQALTSVLSKATQHGVRIVALGLGRPEPSRIPLYDAQQTFQGYMQDQGRVLTTQLNEAPLQQMATTTGGSYYRLTRGDEWHPLLTQPAVVGTALERKEVKMFQLFLACGLVMYGVYQYRARRY